MNLRRTIAASVAALVLALSASGAAFAASSSSGAMTLTVGSAISVSGVPAATTYPSSLGGAAETRTAPQFTVTYSANTAATFAASGTDLVSGSDTIASSSLHVSIGGGASQTLASPRTVEAFGAGGGSNSKTIDLSVDVLATTPAGTYTGTFTVQGS